MYSFHPDPPEVPRSFNAHVEGFGTQARSLYPQYKLILLHDPKKDLMYIVRCVMELTRFPRAEATHKMWEAHHNGRSVILRTHLERAEMFAERFADRGLPVTIEPA
jgi:ATP-dependent Clp protease adapter protein ClpS